MISLAVKNNPTAVLAYLKQTEGAKFNTYETGYERNDVAMDEMAAALYKQAEASGNPLDFAGRLLNTIPFNPAANSSDPGNWGHVEDPHPDVYAQRRRGRQPAPVKPSSRRDSGPIYVIGQN